MKNLNEFIINEVKERKRDVSDLKDWIKNTSKTAKLTNTTLKTLSDAIKVGILVNGDTFKFNFSFSDNDLMSDLAGYIIEAYIYDLIKNNLPVTNRAGRGLKIDGNNIYWDFSIKGIDEKFEIKTKCTNGYHEGGFSYTDSQEKDSELIYITAKYSVTSNSIIIDTKSINVKRGK